MMTTNSAACRDLCLSQQTELKRLLLDADQ